MSTCPRVLVTISGLPIAVASVTNVTPASALIHRLQPMVQLFPRWVGDRWRDGVAGPFSGPGGRSSSQVPQDGAGRERRLSVLLLMQRSTPGEVVRRVGVVGGALRPLGAGMDGGNGVAGRLQYGDLPAAVVVKSGLSGRVVDRRDAEVQGTFRRCRPAPVSCSAMQQPPVQGRPSPPTWLGQSRRRTGHEVTHITTLRIAARWPDG